MVNLEKQNEVQRKQMNNISSTGIDSQKKMYVDKYTIVFDDKVIVGRLMEEEMSLDDVTNIAKSNGYNNQGVLTVIIETMLNGTIYQYGNYGNYWVKHGTTKGLA